MNKSVLKRCLTLGAFTVLSALSVDLCAQQQYRVAACDWMMLKRQKLGEFQLAKDIKAEDVVEGTVYEISDNFGAFTAIDDKYQGLIPKRELYGDVEVGRKVNARVISVREDGKVNLSIRKKSYLQIESDAEKLIEIIKSYDGVLPFTDKASPEVIKRETGMSKNEFKKAVGNLYKNRVIEITENNKIRLI